MSTTDPSARPDTRTAILDAAEAVITRDGARAMTIDAVVTESGFSKGGVLYHFPNKTALLTALVERLIAQFEADVEAAATAAEKKGEPVECHVVAVLSQTNERKKRIAGALLAVTVEQPELLEPARIAKKRMEADLLARATDCDMARILILAMDGMSYREMLGFDPLPEKERAAVRDKIISLTKDLYK